MSKERISGFDLARGLAIIGMIFVNFKTVMIQEGEAGVLFNLIEVSSGKAAALFVVLAGVGMTLMYQSALCKNDIKKVQQVKTSLLKRSLFLFVVGLSYYFIWPADILHYYGVYLLIGTLFLATSKKLLNIVSVCIIVVYIIAVLIFDYEKGWNFSKLEYYDFFTISGFFRNLFFNGFHPVFPWITFLLTGIWIGRINFNDLAIRKQVLIVSIIIFSLTTIISFLLVDILTDLSALNAQDISYIFGTSPMPPMLFYMLSGASLAVVIITLSIYIADKYKNKLLIKQLISAGQLALTNYFLHVVIGMLSVLLFFGKLEKAFSIEFIVAYSGSFSLLIVVLSHYWKSKYKRGPLEWLMRKLTD